MGIIAEAWKNRPFDEQLVLFEAPRKYSVSTKRIAGAIKLLTDFDFILIKASAQSPEGGVLTLIADYDTTIAQLETDPSKVDEKEALSLIRSALRISAHVVTRNSNDLATQLWGRLTSQKVPLVQALLDQIKREKTEPWLRPLSPFLGEIEQGELFTLLGHTRVISALAVTPDGKKLVSSSYDHSLIVWNLETATKIDMLGQSLPALPRTRSIERQRVVMGAPNEEEDDSTDIESLNIPNTPSSDVGEQGSQLPRSSLNIPVSIVSPLEPPPHSVSEEAFNVFGHSAWVTAVAVSPDGRFVVSGSKDRTLKVWDLEQRTEIHTLSGHKDSVRTLAITSDSSYVISGSDDSTIKVWSLRGGGLEVCTLTGHSASVTAVAVSPDGKFIVSGSKDKTLKVWDLQQRTEIHTLSGHQEGIHCVIISSDGRWVISSDISDRPHINYPQPDSDTELDTVQLTSYREDSTLSLIIWDLITGQSEVFEGFNAYSVINVPNKNQLLISSPDGLILWDLETRKEVYKATSVQSLSLAITPDSKQVITIGSDPFGAYAIKVLDSSKIWNPENNQPPPTGDEFVKGIAITPDNKQAISVSVAHQSIKIWDIESGKKIASLVSQSKFINLLVRIRDLRYVYDFTSIPHHGVNAIALTPSGKLAVTGLFDGTIKVWDLQEKQEVGTLIFHNQPIKTIALSPDGNWLVSGSEDGTIKAFNLKHGTELITFSGHKSFVLSVAISRNNRFIFSASHDKSIKIWDLVRRTEIGTVCEGSYSLETLAVVPDWGMDEDYPEFFPVELSSYLAGRSTYIPDFQVIFAGESSEVSVVKNILKPNGITATSLSEHKDTVLSVATALNGRFVISASLDQSLKVTDFELEKVVASFQDRSELSACAVGSDNSTIAFGRDDGSVSFFRLEGLHNYRAAHLNYNYTSESLENLTISDYAAGRRHDYKPQPRYEEELSTFRQAIDRLPEYQLTITSQQVYDPPTWHQVTSRCVNYSQEPTIEIEPKDYMLCLVKSAAYFNNGLFELGLSDCERVIEAVYKSDPNNPTNRAFLKALALKNDMVVYLGREGLELQAGASYKYWFETASLLITQGEFEAALFNIDKALEFSSSNSEKLDIFGLWYTRGEILRGLKRYEEAAFSYDQSNQVKGDNHEAWYKSGICFKRLKQYEQALNRFNHAVALNPHELHYLLEQGNILNFFERDEELLACFDQVVKLSPENDDFWYTRGNALAGLNRIEESIFSYDKALELNPNNATVWNNRSEILRRVERYEEAAFSYEKFNELKDDDPMVWHKLGLCFKALHRYEQALNSLNRAVALNPQPVHLCERANILGSLERFEEAMLCYDKAIELDPSHDFTWYNRGYLLSTLEQYEEAVFSFEKFNELKDDDPMVWHKLGLCFKALHRYEQALNSLNRAVALNPLEPMYRAYPEVGGVLLSGERLI